MFVCICRYGYAKGIPLLMYYTGLHSLLGAVSGPKYTVTFMKHQAKYGLQDVSGSVQQQQLFQSSCEIAGASSMLISVCLLGSMAATAAQRSATLCDTHTSDHACHGCHVGKPGSSDAVADNRWRVVAFSCLPDCACLECHERAAGVHHSPQQIQATPGQ